MSAKELIDLVENPAKFIHYALMLLGLFFLQQIYADVQIVKANTTTLETRVSVNETKIAFNSSVLSNLNGRVDVLSNIQNGKYFK